MSLSSLYSAQPLIVWVEDEQTRVVLTAAWAGFTIGIYIGGGSATIRATAEDAWRSGITHVFGIVDRDSGRSNYHRWKNPSEDLRTYVLTVPEIENFGLDANALADCQYNSAGRNEAEISAKLEEIVEGAVWWMTCCNVLMDVKNRRNEGYPSSPPFSPENLQSLQTALDYITANSWFASTARKIGGYAEQGWLKDQLRKEHERLSLSIQAGTWKTDFSGKEIFRKISQYVYPNPPRDSAKSRHIDLLQAVIQQQVTAGTLSQEINDLRECLMRRVNGTP